MRVVHTSDTHGKLLPITALCIEAVIHSGDLCPDPPETSRFDPHSKELVDWQMNWIRENSGIKAWLDGRPFLFTLGNHDHMAGDKLEEELRAMGIDAYCLHDKTVAFHGLHFYGFPWVPHINGEHAYEVAHTEEMKAKLELFRRATNGAYIDVIVAHCPPRDCLDADLRSTEPTHWGNREMVRTLNALDSEGKLPMYYLCGHCHSQFGCTLLDSTLMMVSNAAATQHILEL